MSPDEFTALLVEFTATHHCSRNWLETVVEWIRTSNDQVENRLYQSHPRIATTADDKCADFEPKV